MMVFIFAAGFVIGTMFGLFIFQMQRYEVTEWMFPKKKKRETARRIRRRKGDSDE